MYIAFFSILINQPSTSDHWSLWHLQVPLLIFGNHSITFHVTSKCYEVFVIYNVPNVLILMILCAEEPTTKTRDKVTEGKFNLTIKQVAGWRNQ